MTSSTILLLGATGYVGGELLVSLASKYPDFPVVALIRNATKERASQLQALHPKLSVVEGAFSDGEVVEKEAAKVDIVINASPHNPAGLKATLQGMKKRAASKRDNPPIYIETFGTSVVGDNSRGELLMPKVWSDMEFKISEGTSSRIVEACSSIFAAGANKEAPFRTLVVFPGIIYGFGSGSQKVSVSPRMFIDLAKAAGQAGTFGAGRNVLNTIHIKDVASGITTILDAVLAGKADEGEQGLYFLVSEDLVNMREYSSIIGDVLFHRGIIAKGGSQPLPQPVADSLGTFGWSIFGGSAFCKADRLAKFGWVPEYSKKTTIFQSLPQEVEQAVNDTTKY